MHDGIRLLDIGVVISGLTPALSISVEPSGIVPPFNVKFEFVPIEESGDAKPPDVALLADPLVESPAEVVIELKPPPSKTEPLTGVEVPDPLSPVVPPSIPEYAANPLVLQFEIGAGLKPLGSISVAPSGIPVVLFDPPDALEPSTPSGKLASGDVIPNRTAAAMKGKSLIERLRC